MWCGHTISEYEDKMRSYEAEYNLLEYRLFRSIYVNAQGQVVSRNDMTRRMDYLLNEIEYLKRKIRNLEQEQEEECGVSSEDVRTGRRSVSV